MTSADGAIATGSILVDKYRVESVLGKGGMGLVYRALHLRLHETVAIKVLRHDAALDRDAVQRFLREAQHAAKLKSQHVARVTDVGTFDDGMPYMVMEFLQGGDLGQMVDANGAMHVPVAADLVLQACDAIAEAHSLGIIHRDIKPSNLFLCMRPDQSVTIKVLDFGISKATSGADLSLTQTSSMLGTPAYMSPEQMRSARTVDARTDVWSIGTVLYELVEGRQPFNAESFSEMCVMVAVDPPAPMLLAPELSPIIERCLAKNPEDRYATVAELMRDLAMFSANQESAREYVARAHRLLGLPVPAGRDSTPPPRPRPMPFPPRAATVPVATSAPTHDGTARSRRGLLIGLCAIVLGLAGGVAILQLGDGSEPATSTKPIDSEVALPSPGSAGSAAATTGSSTDVASTGSASTGLASAGSASDGSASTGSATAGSNHHASAASSGTPDSGGEATTTKSPTRPTTRPTRPSTRPSTRPTTKPATKPTTTTPAIKPTTPTNTAPTVPPKKPCDPFGSRTGCR